MRTVLTPALALVAALCLPAVVCADPIVPDGTVSAAEEYTIALQDAFVFGDPSADETQMAYYNSGLDIDHIYLNADTTARSIAMTVDPVAAPPSHGFDPNGSPMSYAGQTAVNLSFYDSEPDFSSPGSVPDPVLYFNLIFSDDGLEQGYIEEKDPATGNWVQTDLITGVIVDGGVPTIDPTVPTRYTVAIADALEMQFDEDLFRGDVNNLPWLMAQLDDLGGWDDDQLFAEVTGVPEPTALALLAAAALPLLRRRRS